MLQSIVLDLNSEDIELLSKVQFRMLDAIGIAQHHDAITGTSPTKTVNDFADRANRAKHLNSRMYAEAISYVLMKKYPAENV